jgi:hypothetical protein
MADQHYDLPFPVDAAALEAFLTRVLVLEHEQDRWREALRQLKEEYAGALPMRAVLTAVKIVRARHKLATHPKEPMATEHLALLVDQVAWFATGRTAAVEALTRDMDGVTTPLDMTTGEVRS